MYYHREGTQPGNVIDNNTNNFFSWLIMVLDLIWQCKITIIIHEYISVIPISSCIVFHQTINVIFEQKILCILNIGICI